MTKHPKLRTSRARVLFIADWRKLRGLNQSQLGEAVGIGGEQVMRYERGHQYPSIPMVIAIAQALDIEPVDLFRRPDQVSIDAMLRDAQPDVVQKMVAMLSTLRRIKPSK